MWSMPSTTSRPPRASHSGCQPDPELVNIDSLQRCHDKLAFHGAGGRVDTRYCVVCHTEQRAMGKRRSPRPQHVPGAHGTRTVNATTGLTLHYTPETRIATAKSWVTSRPWSTRSTRATAWSRRTTTTPALPSTPGLLDAGQRAEDVRDCMTAARPSTRTRPTKTRAAAARLPRRHQLATGGGSTLPTRQPLGMGSVLATPGTGRAQDDDSRCVLCHYTEVTRSITAPRTDQAQHGHRRWTGVVRV